MPYNSLAACGQIESAQVSAVLDCLVRVLFVQSAFPQLEKLANPLGLSCLAWQAILS